MKLLFDANLSPQLPRLLADLFPESIHVGEIGLDAPDTQVWESAKDSGHCIVSKDDDFRYFSELYGAPPKVIWVRMGNCRTSSIHTLIRTEFERIQAFDQDVTESLLVIP